MDQLIPQKYKEYGSYINAFRSFPLDIDGLKPVERRVLLSAYLVAKEKFTKCPRVDGICVARFHPHSSPYGTLVQLVNQGLLIGQGNFGNNLGVDPSPAAAMRYTECKLNPQTYELMFKYIKHVPWIESESRDDKEPLFLPTMYPVCLFGKEYTQGIGFGYRTIIPTYSMKDLYKRLMWLLQIRKTKPIIKPLSNCIITADDSTLESLLTTGKASISMKGVLKTNAGLCKIAIKSWLPGRKFASILNKPLVKKMLDNNDVGYIDSSNGESGTEIVFSVLKQRNRDKIYLDCLKHLTDVTTGSITFEVTVTDSNSNTRVASIDELLLNTFNMYVDINKKMLQHEIDKANELITEYNNIERVRPYVSDEVRQNITFDIDAVINNIHISSSIKKDVIREVLSKYRISKLFTFMTDTTKLQAKVAEIQNNLSNIRGFVLDQYIRSV